MSGSFWRPSKEQRRTILLLEALAIIHDLGKLSDRFLQSQDPDPTIKYVHNLLVDPRKIDIYKNHAAISGTVRKAVKKWLKDARNKPAAFQERPDLTSLFLRIQLNDWSGTTYNFAELMPLVARPWLAENQPPSEWQEVLGKGMMPGLLVGYFHGVAHIEKKVGEDKDEKDELSKHKQPYSNVFRATPFGREERIETGDMGELTNALNSLPLNDIEHITSDQRRQWLRAMKKDMSRGLADNRRPYNDVTLWDWSFITATLVKAATVWIFKHGWPKSLKNIRFRVLRINFDRLDRYARCHRVADLLGVRRALDDAFQKVRTLLEETYALANCFYHDETGEYYLFPDLEYSKEEVAALRRAIQAQFPPDLRPRVNVGEPITAGQLDDEAPPVEKLVAEPRKQSMQEPAVWADNNIYLFDKEWGEARPENAESCSACGVYPVGYPRLGTSPEMERELGPWAGQDKAERRHICRVCLDRRGRRAEDWAKKGLRGTIWTEEVADDKGRLALLVGRLGLEGWLDGSLVSTIRVTRERTKAPSPARLYRIVETGRSFWQQVIGDLTREVVGQRPFRLALYPAPDSSLELGKYHAYELKIDGLTLDVVWDASKGRFLTVENLTYFARRWQVSEDDLVDELQGRTIDILEPSEFLRPSQVIARVKFERVNRLDGYIPAIPLLAEPSVCMTLVPAAKALELAQAVKRKYEREMGRVRDRLPLYLGLVFCHRRTPLRAVLQAGRNMLNMGGRCKWDDWRLVQKNYNNGSECELVFDNGITWRIPVVTGDGEREDEWYPRMYEGNTCKTKKAEYVKDLQVDLKVWVKPSRFDFEFLDTTGRRFEVYYGSNGRCPRRTRPFYLEDLDRLDSLWSLFKQLTVSQRHQVISIIEATRERWYGQDVDGRSRYDPVFRQFVADTLAGAEWRASSQPDLQGLVEAGVRGELADLAELYMEILKE